MALSRDVNGERLIVSFCDEGGSTIIINDVDFSQALLDMHSKTSATTMLVEQTAISRILQMKKLYKNHNNFCRRRDYCIIPPSCLRKRNRLELLHEPRPGFTLSVLTGPRNRPNESLLLARRNSFSFINGEFMDQLCVYRLSGGQNDFVSDQMREWIHRRDSIPDQTETSLGNSSRKRKKGEIHVVHAYKAWQIFPKRLVGICEDSQSRDIFVDASMSPCGRLICSPYYRGLRLLNMEEALKQDPSQGVSTMEPLSVNLVNKHQAHVVTAQYHPFEPIVAAGSLDGMISVHEADRG
uniref:Uncharacterized protein n=1 Tax=Guillardia theta TaxID=55529 RepID=A0A7S4UJK8_GUITH|mmetsp:Transcript_43586/g.137898  ORF Transcript_43586/g.137898 Transcript_43586/m.137898 type:complete len:296 (+) Transcript_43586:312-1199(+)